MQRQQRGKTGAASLLLLFALLVTTTPRVAPRPVSLVQQEAEAPATSSSVRNKGPSAAAAASRKKPPRTTKSSFPSAAAAGGENQGDDAAASSVLLSSEIEALLFEQPPPLGDNNALALVGEQQQQQRRQQQQQQQRSALLVAGTVDGQVHALDPSTGGLRWSFDTGEPLVKSYQQLPGTLDEKKWLIPTLDGSILVHTTQGLRRPGLKARLLVEQTPFLDPKGVFYTGSKVSRIFGVDARTGEVRQVLSGDTADSLESNRRLLARSGSDDDVIWIGRNDYTIRAFDVPTGQEEWNLTIGEFVSLDDLYLTASSGAGNSRTRAEAARSAAAASTAAALSEPVPSLTATADGSLQSVAAGKGGNDNRVGGISADPPEWDVPLTAHVASVFRVSLEEGSVHTYLPMQQIPLSQSAGTGAPVVGNGSGGTAAVGILENDQVYAVALGEHGGGGSDGGEDGGAGWGPGGHGSRGMKGSRAGEGKVTHGGRTTATQPLLPHGGDWQQQQRDGGDRPDADGGGSGSSSLVQSWSTKGTPQNAAVVSCPPKWCQPGHSAFPSCLVGVHTVQQITGEEQARLSLGMGSQAGGSTALDGGGGGGGAGNHDPKGVRTTSGYIGRLPRPSSQGDGVGDDPNYLTLATASRGPLESLLGWLYRGWSFVSLLLLAVVVAVVVDSRRAAQYLKRAGLGGYPLYSGGAGGGGVGGEYDPTADSGISGASEGSASGAAGGGGGGGGGGSLVASAGGVRGEVRVGCLTVSDTVLGYGSHGTVVYRGLLEGRPVAVKRMLTDFHARADREISLLIESDGHPNVVRYFVREEAGEFVYLALQLCQQSLHNAMAQIHSALAQSRRKLEHENGRSGAPRVGLGRALTADDVGAPRELREALLQVSQGVEHLHSLRIVHRDLKPHNILLAAKERKGPGLGRRSVGAQQAEGGERGGVGDGDGPQVAPKKLSNMQDLAKFVLKISDMGLGKQLLNGQSSFGMSSYGRAPGGRDHGQGGGGGDAAARARASNAQASSSAGGHVGSIGWQAPEVIADRVSLEGGQGPPAAMGGGAESSSLSTSRSGSGASASSWAMAGGPSLSSSRRTQAVDVFSLGCIFHHCIVPGSHPFGQWYEREANIIQDKASRITELEHVPDAHDLVSLMTAREPDLRPSAGEVCKHPFFWNEEKRLSFLLEFSDRLEQDAVQSPLLVMVEAGAHSVVGRSWDVRLDAELTEDAGRYRKYDFSSVRDLLRVVRNKRHHFHELPERVQAMMSPLPGGFLRYVEERFPQLVMHCAKVTGSLLTEERIFKEYLVHFRRPQPPAAAAVPSGTTQSDTPVAAAHTASANGSASKPSAVPEGAVPAGGGSGATAAGASGGVPASGGGGASEATPAGDARGKGGSDQPGAEEGRPHAPAETAALPNGGGAGAAAAAGPASFTSPGKKSAKTTPRSGRKSYTAGGADGGGGGGGAGVAAARVTEQNGPRGEGALQDVLVWNESGMAKSMGCRGWWRHQDHWQRRLDVTKQRPRGAHLNRALQDPKYRTRLCSHWENSKGMLCPMRRRGAGKCDFAHGGLELRVRANKRDRWGRHVGGSNPLDGGGGGGANVNLDASGGEDTLGAARSIGRIRVENGEKDGVGVIGGGGGGGAGGARQGKRNKGGASGGGSGGGATDRSGPRDREPRANGGGGGAAASNGGGFVGPSRERGKTRSRSPRGGRGANGEAAGREARPPAVVAAEGDAAWPPLAASQAERPPPAGLQGQGQRRQEQQRPASAADSGGSSSRESRVDQVVRLVDSGAATGGGAFAQEGGVVADGSGGRGLTRPAAAAAAAGGVAAVTRGERPSPAERGNGKEGRKKVVAREDGVR